MFLFAEFLGESDEFGKETINIHPFVVLKNQFFELLHKVGAGFVQRNHGLQLVPHSLLQLFGLGPFSTFGKMLLERLEIYLVRSISEVSSVE